MHNKFSICVLEVVHSNFIEGIHNNYEINIKEILQFFQKLITNDILNCESNFAFLLTPKAKYIADFIITKHNERIFIEISEDLANEFISKIHLYKIGLKIKLIKTTYYSIFIPDLEIIKNIYQDNNFLKEHNSILFNSFFINFEKDFKQYIITKTKDPRHQTIGDRFIISSSIDEDLKLKINKINQISILFNLIIKYQFNIIDHNELDTSFNMAKYTKNGFSYTKGCYIGQEVISYAKSSNLPSSVFKLYIDLNYIENINADDAQSKNFNFNNINDTSKVNLEYKEILNLLFANQEEFVKFSSNLSYCATDGVSISTNANDIMSDEISSFKDQNLNLLQKNNINSYFLFGRVKHDIFISQANDKMHTSQDLNNLVKIGQVLSLFKSSNAKIIIGFCNLKNINNNTILNEQFYLKLNSLLIKVRIETL